MLLDLRSGTVLDLIVRRGGHCFAECRCRSETIGKSRASDEPKQAGESTAHARVNSTLPARISQVIFSRNVVLKVYTQAESLLHSTSEIFAHPRTNLKLRLRPPVSATGQCGLTKCHGPPRIRCNAVAIRSSLGPLG